MSKYTTEVRFICETYAGYNESQGYPVNNVIEKSREKIFDFDFPIYDEAYRSVLETKILRHYYTREIGFETVALWKHWLDMRLNEIMPYYNQLYMSTTLEFNPFYDVDVTTTGNRSDKYDETHSDNNTSKFVRTDDLHSASSSNATRTDDLKHQETTGSDSTGYELYSDTPQGALTGVDSEEYLTNARKTTDKGTNTTDGSNTGSTTTETSGSVNDTGTQTNEGNNDNNGKKNYSNVNDYLEHVAGKRGGNTYSSLLKEYRETFLNIDQMIINELNDLFMNVW